MSNFFVVDKMYKNYLDDIGVNGELVFKKAGIPYSGIDENGISLSKQQYIAFMESLDTFTKDEHILRISNVEQVVMFVPPLFAAMCSRNGISCFERLATYKKLMGPFVLNITRDNQLLNMEFIFDESQTPIPRFTLLSEQVLMVGLIRKATGLKIVPRIVASIYDYGEGEFEDYFGIRPEKATKNVLAFSLKDMKEPFLTANNTMWNYLEPELKKRIKEMEIDETFAAKVRSKLIELIPCGECTVDDVANELAVSSRTLQRKLLSEQTTFIKQLNHTRELMARNYLKNQTMSNDEIAFLIGYSDANAFSRAFRSWTGMTVGDYREQFESRNEKLIVINSF
jgi:AraC-like DNA-binding protein